MNETHMYKLLELKSIQSAVIIKFSKTYFTSCQIKIGSSVANREDALKIRNKISLENHQKNITSENQLYTNKSESYSVEMTLIKDMMRSRVSMAICLFKLPVQKLQLSIVLVYSVNP